MPFYCHKSSQKSILEQNQASKSWKHTSLRLLLGMAGKKNMKNFEATFCNIKDESVVKKEFLARNYTSALRKAHRLITKHVRVLSVEEREGSQMSA